MAYNVRSNDTHHTVYQTN